MDIVRPLLEEDGSEQPTGFLATTVEEFADAITRVGAMERRGRVEYACGSNTSDILVSASWCVPGAYVGIRTLGGFLQEDCLQIHHLICW